MKAEGHRNYNFIKNCVSWQKLIVITLKKQTSHSLYQANNPQRFGKQL